MQMHVKDFQRIRTFTQVCISWVYSVSVALPDVSFVLILLCHRFEHTRLLHVTFRLASRTCRRHLIQIAHRLFTRSHAHTV